MRKRIKAYLITDSKLYPTSPREFQNFYRRILDSHQIDFACYRDKQNVFNPSLLEVFLKLNQYYKIPSLVNSNLAIALKFGFDGLHCNGMQMQQIAEAKKKIPLVFYSAHSSEEILQADLEGANGITISPIFKTQNKGQPLGIDFLYLDVLSNNTDHLFCGANFLCSKVGNVFCAIARFECGFYGIINGVCSVNFP